jgi:CheY-like chemotaxis protein
MAKILIVEPGMIMRSMISGTLTGGGYDITFAGTPIVALQKIQSGRFALVITAINMEPHTGIWLWQRVMRNRVPIKFAFLCPDRNVADVLRKSLGLRSVIDVPFSASSFIRRIKSLLGSDSKDSGESS